MKKVSIKELKEMRQNGDKVFADFYAEWCGPCKLIMPMLESLEAEYPNVTFVKVDVDENNEECVQMGIVTIPTVMTFNGNNPVSQDKGVQPITNYRKRLDNLIN